MLTSAPLPGEFDDVKGLYDRIGFNVKRFLGGKISPNFFSFICIFLLTLWFIVLHYNHERENTYSKGG